VVASLSDSSIVLACAAGVPVESRAQSVKEAADEVARYRCQSNIRDLLVAQRILAQRIEFLRSTAPWASIQNTQPIAREETRVTK
jgi:hypothetical protein